VCDLVSVLFGLCVSSNVVFGSLPALPAFDRTVPVGTELPSHKLSKVTWSAFVILTQDVYVGIQVTRLYAFLLILQSVPTVRLEIRFWPLVSGRNRNCKLENSSV
jgi:hypothetical protein